MRRHSDCLRNASGPKKSWWLKGGLFLAFPGDFPTTLARSLTANTTVNSQRSVDTKNFRRELPPFRIRHFTDLHRKTRRIFAHMQICIIWILKAEQFAYLAGTRSARPTFLPLTSNSELWVSGLNGESPTPSFRWLVIDEVHLLRWGFWSRKQLVYGLGDAKLYRNWWFLFGFSVWKIGGLLRAWNWTVKLAGIVEYSWEKYLCATRMLDKKKCRLRLQL